MRLQKPIENRQAKRRKWRRSNLFINRFCIYAHRSLYLLLHTYTKVADGAVGLRQLLGKDFSSWSGPVFLAQLVDGALGNGLWRNERNDHYLPV